MVRFILSAIFAAGLLSVSAQVKKPQNKVAKKPITQRSPNGWTPLQQHNLTTTKPKPAAHKNLQKKPVKPPAKVKNN